MTASELLMDHWRSQCAHDSVHLDITSRGLHWLRGGVSVVRLESIVRNESQSHRYSLTLKQSPDSGDIECTFSPRLRLELVF